MQHKLTAHILQNVPYPKMGYLYRPGRYRSYASWKKRFFILENGYLTVYNNHNYYLLPQIKDKVFLKYKKIVNVEIDPTTGKRLSDSGFYRLQIVDDNVVSSDLMPAVVSMTIQSKKLSAKQSWSQAIQFHIDYANTLTNVIY